MKAKDYVFDSQSHFLRHIDCEPRKPFLDSGQPTARGIAAR
jgi:hypothetical protein